MSDLLTVTEPARKPAPPAWFIWPLSRPLTDLHITLILLPVLWLFGLEQIVPIGLIAWAFIKLLFTRKKLIIPYTALIFAAFILWVFVSALSVSAGSNWVVYSRNLIIYLTALFVFLIVINDTQNGRDMKRTSAAILLFSSIVTLIGILFITGFLPDKFEAIGIGYILPGSLKQIRFIQDNVLLRNIGRPNAMLSSIRYSRVSATFLFSNTASLAYIIFIGWTGFSVSVERGKKKGLLVGLLLAQGIIFLSTTSRVAIVAFLVAISCLLLILIQRKLKLPFLIIPIIAGIFLMLGALIVLFPHNVIADFFYQIFFNLRANSFRGRMEVYRASFDLWLLRPFTGWGAPQKVESVNLASAGTHGELFGILFRYGLVGFVWYVSLLTAVWVQIIRKLQKAFNSRPADRAVINFYKAIAVIFLALNLCALTYDFYFDLSFVILNWTVIGLVHVKFETITQWSKLMNTLHI